MTRTRKQLEMRLRNFQNALKMDIWYEHQRGYGNGYRITNRTGSCQYVNLLMTLKEAHLFLDGVAFGKGVML